MGKAETQETLVGRTIAGRFEIQERLGAGAMGAVYRARQIALDRAVAIKVMLPELASDREFVARFHREARAASRLDHPNSVHVLDFGTEPDGLLFLAMEFLDGRTLLRLLREEWPLGERRVVQIMIQILKALGRAHDLGIVHRDLKPENIIVVPARDAEGGAVDIVKVCDFGIAKILDPQALQVTFAGQGTLASEGKLFGTPEYMSPEQGRGEALDPRTDLYSTGVILFRLLTGHMPFQAESALGTILRKVMESAPPASALGVLVHPRLEAICGKALRRIRTERYQTAREMRLDLLAVLAQLDETPIRLQSAPELPAVLPDSDSVSAQTTDSLRAPDDVALCDTLVAGKESVLGLLADKPKPRKSRVLPWAVAFVVPTCLLGAAALYARRDPTPKATVSATPPAPPTASVVAQPETNTRAGALVPTAEATTLAPKASSKAKTPPPRASAVASAAVPVPSAQPAASATPSATPPPTAAPATPLATEAPPPALPPLDVERAFVEIGIINATNVRVDAVRGLLRRANLQGCYRTALRMRPDRTTSTGTLNLSIDGTGRVGSALLVGPGVMPEVTRCVQGSTTGLGLPANTVDDKGAVVEVWLTFRPE